MLDTLLDKPIRMIEEIILNTRTVNAWYIIFLPTCAEIVDKTKDAPHVSTKKIIKRFLVNSWWYRRPYLTFKYRSTDIAEVRRIEAV